MNVYIDFWNREIPSQVLNDITSIIKTRKEIVFLDKNSAIIYNNTDIRCLNVKD